MHGSYMPEMGKPDTTWTITDSDLCYHFISIVEQNEKTVWYKEIHKICDQFQAIIDKYHIRPCVAIWFILHIYHTYALSMCI